MSMKISPLAPKKHLELPAIKGVRLGAIEAGIKYKGRKDLAVILFDKPASVAGVFTKSKCPSAPVEWCQKYLAKGRVKAVVINSGNANAFTGKRGEEAVRQTAKAAGAVFDCKKSEVFLASTGVIGEPMDASGFEKHLARVSKQADESKWEEMARAIMTTDTYPKMTSRSFEFQGEVYTINGVAKGSGMIMPDMATMLSFLVTDFPLTSELLQKSLSKMIEPSFNSISVDSDTSTSDSVMLFSVSDRKKSTIKNLQKGLKDFQYCLGEVLHDLAMLVVRDGEGASKHVQIDVLDAKTDKSAKRIALSVANSPLFKTAIAGEDANWGRVVMAVGKAGEPADRDKLSIYFGDIRVAHKGERDPHYSETAASKIMKSDFVTVKIDIGIGKGKARVWTCDFTADYVAINADYRS